jgi:putative DNA primase/helicase
MQTTTKLKAKEIAPGRWQDILCAAGIERELLTNYLVHKKEGPCPCCGGKSRFIFDDKDGKGTFYCRYCGAGNGFKLMQMFLEKDFAYCARWIEDWYGGDSVEARRPIARVPVQEDRFSPEQIIKNKAKHKTLWESSSPVAEGDPVWKYLHKRIPGFNGGMISKTIRCHRSLPYWIVDDEASEKENRTVFKKLGEFPAMVAYITAPDGTCQDLHRTYITPEGDKAPVEDVKKTVASIDVKGGAIRLVKPTGNVLAVCEGIETAYAVMLFKNLPCWALANTSGMKNFVIPDWVDYLYIFGDNDHPNRFGKRPGFEAAHKLRERAEAARKIVKVHAPTKVGTDMLDLLLGIHARKAA